MVHFLCSSKQVYSHSGFPDRHSLLFFISEMSCIEEEGVEKISQLLSLTENLFKIDTSSQICKKYIF